MEENIFASIKQEVIKLPLQVLDEYMDSFNKTFTGNLVFEIKKRMEDISDSWTGIGVALSRSELEEKQLVSRAYVVAPSLSNYRLLVLKILYKMSEVYPCTIENVLEGKVNECNNAKEVKDTLESLFKSDEFQRPIKMLLAQLQ